MKETSSSHVGGPGAEDVCSSSVSNNCFPQDEGTSSSEMINTECSETSSEVSGSERTRPEHSKKASSVLGKKISIRKKLKMFSRMATLKDDGTVVVDIPTTIEAASLDLHSEDHQDVAFGGEPLDSSDLQDRPPMQIAMLIVGTRGDVQPFIAIGKRLQDYGHRVRLATHANFKDFVMTTGLEFYPLGGDPKILAGYMVKNKGFLPATPSEIPIQRKQIRDIIFSLLPACKDPDIDTGVSFSADAIIANPAAYGHVHVAEALNIPIHIIFTMPWTPTCEFPHPFSHVKQPAGYRLSYQIVDSFVWLGIRDMINDLRKRKLKLRPVTYLSGTHAYSNDIPHAYIWSPYLVPKPKGRCLMPDWGPKIDVVGFCFLDLASDYEPPETLLRWLGSGDSPIYIGFGSLPIPEPDKLTRIIVQALEISGQRGIINKGWGGLGNLEESKEFVYVLDNVPHDWLFLQCKAVVHHGGAGTTAAGLKAGVKERAVELAKSIESEDGVDGAVKSFLKHLPQKRDSETTPTAPEPTFVHRLLHPVNRCFGMAS
ncbi:Sterol 3-beta-glucosyltransferase UGT80A2 [Zea mays]|uniref:sterol 3beta-glucosyltransferase n=2 Tax=Zea mays TaxID=4577 RepID=A0A1D6EKX4_MAIZE|nr:Sterol 3-beta-glucosyltransferase UGT80A2 [Zea mays]